MAFVFDDQKKPRFVFDEPQAKPDGRSVGDIATDAGKSIMGGFASLGQGAVQLADATIDSNPFIYTAKGALSLTDKAGITENAASDFDSAIHAPTAPARDMTAQAREGWDQSKSESLQTEKKNLSSANGVGGTLKAVYQNPSAAADMAIESLPNMLIPAAGARVAASRVAVGMANKLTGKALQSAATKSATKAAAITGGIMEGASSGSEAYNSIMKMTPEQLFSSSDGYRELIDSGVAHDAAIKTMARKAGMTAQAIATPIAILASSLTGAAGVEAQFFTGQGAKKLFSSVLKETAEEAVQEAGSTFGSNVGVKIHGNKDQELSKGIAESATLGGVLGGVQGGSMNAIGRLSSGTQDVTAQEDKPDDQQNDQGQDQDFDLSAEIDRLKGVASEPIALPAPPIYVDPVPGQIKTGNSNTGMESAVPWKNNEAVTDRINPVTSEEIANLESVIDNDKKQLEIDAAYKAVEPSQVDPVRQEIDKAKPPTLPYLATKVRSKTPILRKNLEQKAASKNPAMKQAMASAMEKRQVIADIDTKAKEAATSPDNDAPLPTDAQKDAGNYKKGHIKVHGIDISIENPKGSKRSGTDPDGKRWDVEMRNHYGYIRRTKGADSDQVDVFIGPNPSSERVFIVDQINKDGSFDEHKVLMGFDSRIQAVSGYKSNYAKGWKVGPVSSMKVDQFKSWLKTDNTKPLRDGKNVASGMAKEADKKPGIDSEEIQTNVNSVDRLEVRAEGSAEAETETEGERSESKNKKTKTKEENRATIEAKKEASAYAGRGKAEILANKVAADFIDRGHTSLIGQKINNSRDLATLASVYRNPKFETFRLFFVGDDGKVNGQTGITSRMPGGVTVIGDEGEDGFYRLVKDQMKKSGSTKYYLLHNHPSGLVDPSDSDIAFTKMLSSSVRGFAGHVIINGRKYTVIDKYGTPKEYKREDAPQYEAGKNPSKPSSVLGREISSARNLVEIAKELEKKDTFQIIGISRDGVSGIASVPVSTLEAATKGKIPSNRLIAELRRFQVQTASMSLFAANVPGKYRGLLKTAVLASVLTDVVYSDSTLERTATNPSHSVRTKPIHVKENGPLYRNDPYSEALKSVGNKDRTVAQKAKLILKRNLSPGGLLPDLVFKEKIARDSEIRAEELTMRNHVARLNNAVLHSYGKPYNRLTESERNAINAQLGGVDVNRAIPEAVRVELMAMRGTIKHFSTSYMKQLVSEVEKLQAKGKDAQAESKIALLETIAENMDTYLNRSYRAFDDPDWPKKVSEDVKLRAAKYLERQIAGDGPVTEDIQKRVIQKLRRILEEGTAHDTMHAFIAESKLGAKDLSILKRRKDIAPEIRDLLGEYKDARINFVKTTTKMSRLVFNQAFLEKVKEDGIGNFLFEDGDPNMPPSFTAKIAGDDSEVYAPLNGLYTSPEIAQAFKDALGKQNVEGFFKWVIRLNGFVKYGKTILSPTTQARNVMSASFFAMANGHFDVRDIHLSIKSFSAHMSGTGKKVEYLKKLTRLGVLYDNPYAGELMDLLADSNLEQTLLGKDWARRPKAVLDAMQKLYQYGDDFWKIMGFENEKRMLMKYRGMSESTAETEAAERIRNIYPTYSMTGRFINKLRRFPLAGTFVSFPAEIVRTSYHILRYAKKDMKEAPKMGMHKLAGIAVASFAIHGIQAALKALNGVSEEEENAYRIMAPEWQKNSNFMFLGRDDAGDRRVIDLSFLDPYNYWKRPFNALMRDQPIKDSMISATKDMLTPFFGEDITAGAFLQLYTNRKESGGEVFNEDDPSTASQAKDIALFLGKKLGPGVFSNASRIIKAHNKERSASGRMYNMKDEAIALVGWRISTHSPSTALFYRSYDFKDAKSNASKILNSVARSPNKVSDKELESAVKQSIKARNKAYKEMITLVNAARTSGMTDAQIGQALHTSNIGKQDIGWLLAGKVPPWTPPSTSMRNAIRKAVVLFDKETQEMLIGRGQKLMNLEGN